VKVTGWPRTADSVVVSVVKQSTQLQSNCTKPRLATK
jgi:hypothetical protein